MTAGSLLLLFVAMRLGGACFLFVAIFTVTFHIINAQMKVHGGTGLVRRIEPPPGSLPTWRPAPPCTLISIWFDAYARS